jgi:hypothetical protein
MPCRPWSCPSDLHIADVTSATDAMADVAARLEGMAEELTDIALDALRLGAQCDPDSAEAGEALRVERRIVRARRAIEKAVTVLAPYGETAIDDGA